MTPRYVRVYKGLDVRVLPTALNASMIPGGPYRLVFYRVPKLHTLDIEKHLRHGISSPHGGFARIDLRYVAPHAANLMNGINNMKWGWLDPITGRRMDCTSPLNGSLPSDRPDDDIFIVNAELLQKDCFIIWYDGTVEVIFLDIGGLEPRYLVHRTTR